MLALGVIHRHPMSAPGSPQCSTTSGNGNEALSLLRQVIANPSQKLSEGHPATLEAPTSLAFARLSTGTPMGPRHTTNARFKLYCC